MPTRDDDDDDVGELRESMRTKWSDLARGWQEARRGCDSSFYLCVCVFG